LLNKKGQTIQKEQISLIWYAIFLVFVALVIAIVFAQAVDRELKTSELEQHISLYRILSSPDCFNYVYDGQISFGIVNLSKFDSQNLEKCFGVPSGRKIGIEFSLLDLNGAKIGVAEINKELIAQKITCGLKSSNYDCMNSRKYILYWDSNKMNKGVLDVVAVTAKD